MKEFFKTIKLNFDTSDSLKKLRKELSEVKMPDFGKMFLGDGDPKRVKELEGLVSNVTSKSLDKLKSILDDALDELSDITKYSRMTDAEVRELKLGYGFSSSQAYGYDKAMGMLGIGSMEDLMWADSQQLAQFRRLFEKYSNYYEETMTPEYVEKQLEYQVAMEEFKLDLQNSVISFFLENQDTIMSLMDLSIDFMKFVTMALGNILKAFSNGGRSENARDRETSSILSSYTSNTKNTNINQTNNFNNVSKQDQTWLQNSSQLAYKQLVEQYNRG